MKISDKKYYCPWCDIIFKQDVGKSQSEGKKRGTVTSQCMCPNCRRYVSQKTKLKLTNK